MQKKDIEKVTYLYPRRISLRASILEGVSNGCEIEKESFLTIPCDSFWVADPSKMNR